MPSIDNSSLDSAPNTTAATTATTTTGRGQNPKALFITGLSLDAEFIDLHKHFDRFGEIVLCRVLKDAKTGVSRGIGYVNYDSEAEAAAAQAATDGQPGPRDEPSISVKFAEADPTYRAVATTKVFVRYVPVDFTTAQVAEVFSKYGKVLDVVIDADRSRAVKKGPTPWNYAYVQYGTTAEANKAIAYGAREVQWSSRPITVKPAEGEETRQLRCGKTATTTTTTTAAPQTTQPQQPAHPPTASTTRSNTPIKDANAKPSSAAASTAAASAPATPPASVSLVQPDIPNFAFPQSAAATTNTAATYTMALPQSADFFVQPDGVCAQQPTFVFAPAGAMAMAPQPTYFMAAPGGAPQFFAPQQPGAMQYVQFMPYHTTAPTMHCGVAPANAVSPQWLSMPTMTAAPAPSPYTSMASPWATEHTVHPFLATF